MADGKIKGKQVEDQTVSLNKMSGLGTATFSGASRIQTSGTFSINSGSFSVINTDINIDGGNIEAGDNFQINAGEDVQMNLGDYSEFNLGEYAEINGLTGFSLIVGGSSQVTIGEASNVEIGDASNLNFGDFSEITFGYKGQIDAASESQINFQEYSSITLGNTSSLTMGIGSTISLIDSLLSVTGSGRITVAGTAIGPNDVITKKELDSVGGQLTVTDFNSGASFSNIENIIFRGQTVLVPPSSSTASGVDVQGAGAGAVTVWIPAPTYVDYFNQGDAALTPEATTSRFIGKPNGAYEVGDWTDFSVARDVLNEPSSGQVSYTVTDFSVLDGTTTLDFTIYDGTGASLSTVSQTVGTNSTTLNGLTINVTAYSTDQDRFKASATFTADLTNVSLIPDGGRFSVEIVHNNSTDGTYTFNQNDIFYDSDGSVSSANIGSVTVQETTPVLAWRSGIAYYSDNSSFTFSVLTIDNINDRSYPRGVGTSWNNNSTSNQVRLSPLNFNMDISYGHSTDFDGWSSSYNVSGIDWIFSDSINAGSTYIPDVNSSNNLDTSVVTRIRANYYDWSQSSNFDSAAFDALIDTYDYTDTDLIDPVGDESKRLSFSDLTFNSGSWDSTAVLGDDYLQVAFDKMFYPREDYSAYNPNINITNARDYSALGAGATQSFEVYTQVSVNDASTTINLGGYKWYVSHFLLGAVSNTGTFTFTSNIVESDFEIELGNNANAGDDDIAILVGHDSGSAGAGTVPDKWIYVTGDYSGRTATTNNFDGSPKEISYTWGNVGNYSRIWIAVGINTNKQNRYISQISLAAGT